ncbi:MAG: TVP38/TMEM64 family protein, partial [Burkholderiales bacterium]
RPVDPEVLVQDFVPPDARKPLVSRVWRVAIALIALGALAAAWRWTPLRELVSLEALVRIAHSLQDSSVAPLAVLAAYVVAGLLVVPVTVMIVATGLVFGPVLGATYALSGALLSAFVTYWLGRHLGRNMVRRLAGSRLNRITRRLAKKGTMAIAAVRLLPIAPFSVVNAVAGASQIGLREFLIGTAVGMAPGIIVTVAFVDRVAAAVTDPHAGTIAVLVLFAVALVAAAVYVHRRFGRSDSVAGHPAGK